MTYVIVASGSRFKAGIGSLSEYPGEAGDDAVRVSSAHSSDFVARLVGRVLCDYHDACGGRHYHDLGPLEFAEVLRDFYGFEILGCGLGGGGEGMVVDLGRLYGRFCIQGRYLVQHMGVFDRDGLRERLAEIGRSKNVEPGEGESYILDIDGYARIINGKLVCIEPGSCDIGEYRETLFRLADALYRDPCFPRSYGKDTVYRIAFRGAGSMHFDELPVSTQEAVKACGHGYHV